MTKARERLAAITPSRRIEAGPDGPAPTAIPGTSPSHTMEAS